MEGSNMAEIIYALRPNISYILLKPKPWIRKVRTSRGHLLVEKRTILEAWYVLVRTLHTIFRNKKFAICPASYRTCYFSYEFSTFLREAELLMIWPCWDGKKLFLGGDGGGVPREGEEGRTAPIYPPYTNSIDGRTAVKDCQFISNIS